MLNEDPDPDAPALVSIAEPESFGSELVDSLEVLAAATETAVDVVETGTECVGVSVLGDGVTDEARDAVFDVC